MTAVFTGPFSSCLHKCPSQSAALSLKQSAPSKQTSPDVPIGQGRRVSDILGLLLCLLSQLLFHPCSQSIDCLANLTPDIVSWFPLLCVFELSWM